MKSLNGFWWVTLALVAFSACSEPEPVEEIVEAFASGTPHLVEVYQGEGDERQLIGEKEYYESGNVKIEGALVDGLRTGVWYAYFENGVVQSEYNYKAGRREGKCVVRYENGQTYYEGLWENDVKVGSWSYYLESGDLGSTIDYGNESTPPSS